MIYGMGMTTNMQMLANIKGRRVSPAAAIHACRSQEGQALVEFTLVLPVVLLILFGIAYFGIALNDWIDETQLASEGARYAEVGKTCVKEGAPHACGAGENGEAGFLAWLAKQGDNSQVQAATATMCSPNSESVEVMFTYKYQWAPILKLHAAETQLTSTAQMYNDSTTQYKHEC